MPEELNERVRVNAKQTSKAEWYFECTFEDTAANVDNVGASKRLLETVQAVEREFTAAGKKLAGT